VQLSIIIVNYNVKYFLEQCLCSVREATQHLQTEVWVVDNASSDKSIEYLKPKFTWVNFMENNKNVGFAKANNQALNLCSGKYVLFLNPDTLIPEDSLTKCIAFMENYDQAGATGVRMIDGSGTFLAESKRSLPSPLAAMFKLLGFSRLFPASKVFSRYALTYLDEFKNHEVDVLSGAFMLVKKTLLLDLKGFDEAFFMYGEDIDLSYRILKSGYKNYYFSGSTIIHFKGESTRKGSLRYIKIFYQAMNIFVKKHYRQSSAYFVASFIHAAIWLMTGASAALQVGLKTKRFLFAAIKSLNGSKNNEKLKKQYKIFIAGTAEEYEEVKALLDKAESEQRIMDRTTINEKKESTSAVVFDLEQLPERGNLNEVIFCRGEASYSYIIDQIQRLPKEISLRFHAKGSGSIVGSDAKNTSGQVVNAGTDPQ
jgi:GT2 family glycosyltransferase